VTLAALYLLQHLKACFPVAKGGLPPSLSVALCFPLPVSLSLLPGLSLSRPPSLLVSLLGPPSLALSLPSLPSPLSLLSLPALAFLLTSSLLALASRPPWSPLLRLLPSSWPPFPFLVCPLSSSSPASPSLLSLPSPSLALSFWSPPPSALLLALSFAAPSIRLVSTKVSPAVILTLSSSFLTLSLVRLSPPPWPSPPSSSLPPTLPGLLTSLVHPLPPLPPQPSLWPFPTSPSPPASACLLPPSSPSPLPPASPSHWPCRLPSPPLSVLPPPFSLSPAS
jgi:hypothetical protein